MLQPHLHHKAIYALSTATILFLILVNFTRADGPTVTVAAPSHDFGDVGAALGNVWNMDSLADIPWTQPNASGQTVQYAVQNGVTGAYGSVLRGVTPQGSDLASAFYTDENVSIPSNIYRYLVYRSFIPNHQPGEGGIESTNGRVLYSPQWGDNWLFQSFPFRRFSEGYVFQIQENCAYGDWCVLFFDLTQDLNSPVSPNPWDWGQPGAEVRAFGIWPHENWANPGGAPSGDSPNFFYLDYAYLTGEIVTSQPPESKYTVKWNVNDADGGVINSTLYYQEQNELLLPASSPTCDASLSGWTPVPGGTTSLNLPTTPFKIFLPLIIKPTAGGGPDDSPFGSGQTGAFNQSFEWDLSSGTYTTGKVYYVCLMVEDGDGNKSFAASNAPVIKVPKITQLVQ